MLRQYKHTTWQKKEIRNNHNNLSFPEEKKDPSRWTAISAIAEKRAKKISGFDGIRTHASQIIFGRYY